MPHESTHQLIRSHLEMSTCILQIRLRKTRKTTRVRVGVSSPILLSMVICSVIDTIAHDSSIRCERYLAHPIVATVALWSKPWSIGTKCSCKSIYCDCHHVSRLTSGCPWSEFELVYSCVSEQWLEGGSGRYACRPLWEPSNGTSLSNESGMDVNVGRWCCRIIEDCEDFLDLRNCSPLENLRWLSDDLEDVDGELPVFSLVNEFAMRWCRRRWRYPKFHVGHWENVKIWKGNAGNSLEHVSIMRWYERTCHAQKFLWPPRYQ
jgi:hypothetical protein